MHRRSPTLSSPPARLISLRFLAVGLFMVGGLGACGDSTNRQEATSRPMKVVAAFAPLEEAARQIGGKRVSVTDLTPLGGEPHQLTPDATAINDLKAARLVLFLGGDFQPAVTEAIRSLRAPTKRIDLLDGQTLRPADRTIPGIPRAAAGDAVEAGDGQQDPHVWVDPARFVAIAERIQAALIAADPAGRATYEANGRRYVAGLRAVEADFKRVLASCRSKIIVTNHAAFGYLADQYGLRQAVIAGISPEAAPDPRSVAATAKFARTSGVTTVFFSSAVPRKLAATVADEIGARASTLDPVEGLTQDGVAAGATYASIMRENLARLRQGLRCKAP